MVGIKAVVFGSVVGEGSIIGMSALILKNSRIPPRSVAVGVPAKIIKKVDKIAYSRIKNVALRYNKISKAHKGTLF